MNDPIVDEVRRVRDAYVATFSHDLDAVFRDIEEQEQKSGLQFVAGVAHLAAPPQTPLAASSGGTVPDGSSPLGTAPAGDC